MLVVVEVVVVTVVLVVVEVVVVTVLLVDEPLAVELVVEAVVSIELNALVVYGQPVKIPFSYFLNYFSIEIKSSVAEPIDYSLTCLKLISLQTALSFVDLRADWSYIQAHFILPTHRTLTFQINSDRSVSQKGKSSYRC